MLCITIKRNVMKILNCACAYNHTAERNLLLIILLLLRTALALYWQSFVHFNCACSITIRYYYTRSRKSKWLELVAKYQVQWTRIMMNTRLVSSVRIKTRMRTQVTQNRISANAYNSCDYEIRLKCAQDWSRLGFLSALPQLRLIYALATISCEHCRSLRNNPHYAPRHIIYYYQLDVVNKRVHIRHQFQTHLIFANVSSLLQRHHQGIQ